MLILTEGQVYSALVLAVSSACFKVGCGKEWLPLRWRVGAWCCLHGSWQPIIVAHIVCLQGGELLKPFLYPKSKLAFHSSLYVLSLWPPSFFLYKEGRHGFGCRLGLVPAWCNFWRDIVVLHWVWPVRQRLPWCRRPFVVSPSWLNCVAFLACCRLACGVCVLNLLFFLIWLLAIAWHWCLRCFDWWLGIGTLVLLIGPDVKKMFSGLKGGNIFSLLNFK